MALKNNLYNDDTDAKYYLHSNTSSAAAREGMQINKEENKTTPFIKLKTIWKFLKIILQMRRL